MHVCVEGSPDLSFCELPQIKAAGRLQVLMPQDFLDVPNGAATLQQVRCSRVSQDMWGHVLTETLKKRGVRSPEHRLDTSHP